MRLGILSDTHNEVERTQRAIEQLRAAGAEALFHCGDLASPPIVAALAVLPSWFVFGNHDADVVPQLRQAAAELGPVCLGWHGVVDLAGTRIGLVHGHLFTDLRKVLAEHPHYVFSGHSHIIRNAQHGSVRRINPGALFRADRFTVALLDLASGTVEFLEISK